MATKKKKSRPLRLYFVDRNTDEVLDLLPLGARAATVAEEAKLQGFRIAMARTRAAAEDVAAGLPRDGARLFNPESFRRWKTKKVVSSKRKGSSKRRTSRR